MSRGSTVASSLWWAFGDSIVQLLLSFLFLIIVSRLLDPAEFGVAALALGFVTLSTGLIETLFRDAIVQRREISVEHLDTAHCVSIGSGVMLVTVCVALAPVLSRIFGDERLGPVVAVASVSILFGAAAGPLSAELRRAMQFRALALRTSAARVSGMATGIAAALAGFGVWSIVLQQMVAAACATLVLWTLAGRRPALKFSMVHLRQLLPFASSAVTIEFLWLGNSRIFIALVGYFLGPAAVGYVDVAWRIVDVVARPLKQATQSVSLPLFSRHQHDQSSLQQLFLRATEFAAAPGFLLFGTLLILAELIVKTMLGSSWIPIVPLVQLFSAMAMSQLVILYAASLLIAVGRPGLNVIWSLISLVSGVILFFAFGRQSLLWAGLAWVAQCAIEVPLCLLLVRRATGIGVGNQVSAVGPAFFAAVAMLLSVGGLTFGGFGTDNIWSMLGFGLAGTVAYVGVLVAQRPGLPSDLIRLMSGARARARHRL